MSSNSTASPAANTPPCCKAAILVAAATTSFVFCFLLVVAFLFLRFILLRRRWRRRARLLEEQQLPQRKAGLDAAAIALIPSFPYRRADAAASSCSVPADCAVCLNVLDEGQTVRQLPGCKHVFHQECIDVWLASRASCPVCRGKADAEPPARPEERCPAASTSSARVVAIDMVDDDVLASSPTPAVDAA